MPLCEQIHHRCQQRSAGRSSAWIAGLRLKIMAQEALRADRLPAILQPSSFVVFSVAQAGGGQRHIHLLTGRAAAGAHARQKTGPELARLVRVVTQRQRRFEQILGRAAGRPAQHMGQRHSDGPAFPLGLATGQRRFRPESAVLQPLRETLEQPHRIFGIGQRLASHLHPVEQSGNLLAVPRNPQTCLKPCGGSEHPPGAHGSAQQGYSAGRDKLTSVHRVVSDQDLHGIPLSACWPWLATSLSANHFQIALWNSRLGGVPVRMAW